MRTFLRILLAFAGFLVVVNAAILLTGKTYIYKGFVNTYLNGRITASIDEYRIFHNNTVQSGIPRPWPPGSDYNAHSLPPECLSVLEKYLTVAFLILRDDSLRFEKYWKGYGPSSYSNSFSMAKSIMSILTGIALSEGKIKSIDQKVCDFLPEYCGGEKEKITIRHLLTMSTGLDFDEHYFNPLGYAAEAYFGTDLRKTTFRYEAVEEPGKILHYASGNTQILGFVLRTATGTSVSRYASEKLWKPLGAEHPAYWSMDRKGGDEKSYCCFNSNARDFARIGQLYLNKGMWNGRQVVPSWYVDSSLVPAPLMETDGSPNRRYGFSWWLLRHQERDIFYARGVRGQYIIVIPSEKMVIVRLGHWRSVERRYGHPDDLFEYLDCAINFPR